MQARRKLLSSFCEIGKNFYLFSRILALTVTKFIFNQSVIKIKKKIMKQNLKFCSQVFIPIVDFKFGYYMLLINA